MRLWVKIGLFLSAYLPLFIILVIRTWYDFYMTLLLLGVTVYSVLVWAAIVLITKTSTSETYRIADSEEKMKEALNYLIPYIISFIGFNLEKWQDWSALIILLVILGVVYINSNLLYINPMLSFFRYKIFQAKIFKPSTETTSEIMLLTKKQQLRKNDDISIKRIDEDTFLEVR